MQWIRLGATSSYLYLYPQHLTGRNTPFDAKLLEPPYYTIHLNLDFGNPLEPCCIATSTETIHFIRALLLHMVFFSPSVV